VVTSKQTAEQGQLSGYCHGAVSGSGGLMVRGEKGGRLPRSLMLSPSFLQSQTSKLCLE